MTGRSAPALRRLLCVAPCSVTLVALAASTTPGAAKIVMAAVLIVTLADPAEGLLLTAALAPLGAFFAALFDLGPFRLTEAIVVAFIAGWLLRNTPAVDKGPGLPRYGAAAAWLFAALVTGSIVVLGLELRHSPGALRQTLLGLARTYYVFTDGVGVVEGAKMVEGLALVAATVGLFGRRPSLSTELPAALGASVVCAALTSVLVWFRIGPDQLLVQQARIGYRGFAHVADVNAAGSHFALVLGLGLGMIARGRRVSSRVLWALAIGAAVLGLWLTGSKPAVLGLAAAVALVTVWAASRTWSGWARSALLAAVLAVAAGGAIGLRVGSTGRSSGGVQQPTEFTAASLRLIAARPIFGVGVGRYVPDPALFSASPAWSAGSEDAHGYFVQVGAETGVVGLTLFALLLAGGIGAAARAITHDPRDFRLLGATAGVVALLATCVTGHPLLVPEVAAAFWMQFGLMAALGSSRLLNLRSAGPANGADKPPAWSVATIASAVVMGVAVPWVARGAPLVPPESAAVNGFYGWAAGTSPLMTPCQVIRRAASLGLVRNASVSAAPIASVAAKPNVDGHMKPIRV